MKERQIKRMLPTLLKEKSFAAVIGQLREFSTKYTVSALLSGIYQTDEVIKWHSIQALGLLMNDLAQQNMEDARLIMRRILWSLNEESGGIGWGMPEALGEVMACNKQLADEYGHLLVSYMREENYLELLELQRGLMWGIGRLAQTYPANLLNFNADGYMALYLESPDKVVLGLASRNFGILKIREAAHWIKQLYDISTPIRLFVDGEFVDTNVGELAREAVVKIEMS